MTCYVWYQNTVDIVGLDIVCSTFVEDTKYLKYFGCFLVDDRFGVNNPGRQGYFTKSEIDRPKWVNVTTEELPEEFKIQLMLLGVQ